MPKVVFIGSANMDKSIKLKAKIPGQLTRECTNESTETITPGGKALNQALAFIKQFPGADVHFIGCVGTEIKPGKNVPEIDANGQVLKEILEKAGIGIEGLKVIDKVIEEKVKKPDGTFEMQKRRVKTDGRVITVSGEDGDYRMTGYGDCIKELTRENIPEMDSILEGADLVVIQLKMPPETVRYVIEYCSRNNVKLLVDPTPLDKSRILVENNCELLKKATYLSPNEEEAFALAMYAAGKNLEEIDALFRTTSSKQRTEMIKALVRTSPNIFATMGGDGVIFNRDGEIITQETYPTFCNDATGAGDTFNGAFAAAIMRDEDYETAILYGLMASSLKVQRDGAQNGVPSYEEIENRMEEEERPPFVVDGDKEVVNKESTPKETGDEVVITGTTDGQHSTDDNDGDEPR